MPQTVQLKINASHQQEALIRHAAEIARKNMDEFILDSICAAAENALLDHRLFLLDNENWWKFQDALDQPPKFKKKII